MMIGGAGLLHAVRADAGARGTQARWATTRRPTRPVVKFIQYLGFGGIIVGLSVFQIEFDFGVPQFRQVFQPMLIAAAAAFALVAARVMLGRGAAIIAALLAVGLRGGVALIVGPILGSPINWFALYLGPAIVVELIGADATAEAARPIRCRQRPWRRPPSDCGWSRCGSERSTTTRGRRASGRRRSRWRFPSPSSPARAARCSALVLTSQRLPSRAISIGLVALTVLVIGGATANGLRYDVPQDVTATVTLTDVPDSSPASGW